MEFEFNLYDSTKHVQVSANKLKIGENETDFEIKFINRENAYIRMSNQIYEIYDIQIGDDLISFMYNGLSYSLPFKDEQAILLAKMGFKSGKKSGQGAVKSPMPGKIISLKKQIGDTVEAGEAVVILEAMKMENELKSPISGTVDAIHVTVGTSVEKNTILLEIK
jgi:acetyl/propionyl-CoA carboxylase alpha subunit